MGMDLTAFWDASVHPFFRFLLSRHQPTRDSTSARFEVAVLCAICSALIRSRVVLTVVVCNTHTSGRHRLVKARCCLGDEDSRTADE